MTFGGNMLPKLHGFVDSIAERADTSMQEVRYVKDHASFQDIPRRDSHTLVSGDHPVLSTRCLRHGEDAQASGEDSP